MVKTRISQQLTRLLCDSAASLIPNSQLLTQSATKVLNSRVPNDFNWLTILIPVKLQNHKYLE